MGLPFQHLFCAFQNGSYSLAFKNVLKAFGSLFVFYAENDRFDLPNTRYWWGSNGLNTLNRRIPVRLNVLWNRLHQRHDYV